MIKIAGAGLRGMSCAIKLLDSGIDVTIYETRQEIGNPIRSPGIIKNLNPEFIKNSNAIQTEFGWALRREWLEKEMARLVMQKGGRIILKTESPEDSIDCKGKKSSAPGWPSDNYDGELVVWSGGITIPEQTPEEFFVGEFSHNKFAFERGDGLVECWIRGNLPEHKQGWLELIQGEHPTTSDLIWADESIVEGQEIAKRIIQSLQEV